MWVFPGRSRTFPEFLILPANAAGPIGLSTGGLQSADEALRFRCSGFLARDHRKVCIVSLPISSKTFSGGLIALLIFNALSAFVGGVMAIFFDGAGVPREHLEGTWFPSFIGPGLILGIVVGGTQAAAAFALLTRRRWALLAAAVAGFAMLIWIFTEVAIIGYFWLQSAYFGLGTLELILVLALLGIAPAITSPEGKGPGNGLPAGTAA